MSKTENKSFLKNVLTLMTGTVVAQIISLVAMIVLQRFFIAPDEYGPFRLFFEFVAIFTGVSALRLESGIILEKEESKARHLTSISLKIVLITSVISLISFVIYSQFTTSFESITDHYWLVFLIPVSVYLSGALQVFNAWFTRAQSFKLMSTNKVAQNSVGSIGQILLGWLHFSFIGLIIGRVIGLLSGSLLFLQSYLKGAKKFDWNKSERKALIKKHKDFIWYSSPSILIGNMINFLLLALFSHHYSDWFGGDAIVGEIAASYQYLGMSIAIVSVSFSQVYFSKIAKIESKEELRATYTYWVKRLGIIAIIGIALVYIIPNSFVVAILGAKWDGLLSVIQIMAVWMGIMFVTSSLSYIYIKVGRQKEIMIFDIFHLVLVFGSIELAEYLYHKPMISLWWYTIAQCIFYITALLLAYRYISRYQEQKTPPENVI